MRLYLSRQYNNQYMLTAIKPRLHQVGNSGHEDLYVRAGEPVGYRNMCAESMDLLIQDFQHLKPLETIVVEITARIL